MTLSSAAPRRGPTRSGVPLVDLAAQHDQVAEEVALGWAEVLKATAFVGGPQVTAFEAEFAEYSGVRHCIGVANGTDALELALRALGVGPGDECMLPANTFIATAEAVARAGAVPVLVDCVEDTALIDVDAIMEKLGPRIKVIVPVHLYGQTAPVEEIVRIANANGVAVLEDAAQAQGARRHGVTAGALGDIAATSFYPGKNLGAYGDAGAVLTGDKHDLGDGPPVTAMLIQNTNPMVVAPDTLRVRDGFRRDEGLILSEVDYSEVPGLSNEARSKLEAARPRTVGQAGRLDGLTPAALGILAAYLRREARKKTSVVASA